MRVLQVHSFYSCFGGEDRVAMNEAEALSSAGHDVISFSRDNGEIWKYNLAKKAGLPIRVIRNRLCMKELRTIVDRTRPDIAHIHNIYPLIPLGIYQVLWALGLPIVQSLHDHRLSLLCPQGNSYRSGAPCDLCHKGNFVNCVRFRCVRSNLPMSVAYSTACWLLRQSKIFERYVSALICPNEYMLGRIGQFGLPPDKVFIKPHFLPKDPGQPSYVQGKYALFLGAVSKHKGILTAIEAFARTPSIGLRIIGEGDLEKTVLSKIREMGNIQLLGPIRDDSRLNILRDASCLIAPSECWETFGMNIIESFACGVPVIASRTGAFPFLVQEGRTGHLFPMGRPDELLKVVQRVFENRHVSLAMGKLARKEYETKYTPKINVQRIIEIYNSVIGRHTDQKSLGPVFVNIGS